MQQSDFSPHFRTLFFVAALDFRDNSHNAFIFSQHSAVNVLDRAYSNGIIYLHESGEKFLAVIWFCGGGIGKENVADGLKEGSGKM